MISFGEARALGELGASDGVNVTGRLRSVSKETLESSHNIAVRRAGICNRVGEPLSIHLRQPARIVAKGNDSATLPDNRHESVAEIVMSRIQIDDRLG